MSVGFAPRRGPSGWAERAGRPHVRPLVEPRLPASPEAVSLLAQARYGLVEAEREGAPDARFVASYLSALRAGAAVLVAKGRPHRRAARPQSVWALLVSAAPEVRQWAEYFAASSARYAAAQAGSTRRVDVEGAAELHRRAGDFLAVAHRIVHGPDVGRVERDRGEAWCGARSRWRGGR